jgi:hypothetical protein
MMSFRNASTRTIGVGLVAVLSVLLWRDSAQTVTAQSTVAIDPGLYAGMTWRSIGPDRGGRSIAVAGSDTRPS